MTANTNLTHLRSISLVRQSGAVMVISLVLLVLLTLVGVTSSQVTGLEEMMAGNMRDRNIAFQAAEAGLRDAEREILNAITGINVRFCATTGFRADCGFGTADRADDGLCRLANGNNINAWTALINAGIWNNQTVMRDWPSIPYGYFTNVPPIPNVSAQPRYIIEGFTSNNPGVVTPPIYYRITSRGQGLNPNTEVWLQSVFALPQNNCN